MKSVYVDDALHQKLKRLAQENGQTLLALLNRLVQEGIERLEKNRYRSPSPTPDPVGMFGTSGHGPEEIETTMQNALLLPRDAYHWDLMQTHGLNAIATTDADFTRLPESVIYTCNEKILLSDAPSS